MRRTVALAVLSSLVLPASAAVGADTPAYPPYWAIIDFTDKSSGKTLSDLLVDGFEIKASTISHDGSERVWVQRGTDVYNCAVAAPNGSRGVDKEWLYCHPIIGLRDLRIKK